MYLRVTPGYVGSQSKGEAVEIAAIDIYRPGNLGVTQTTSFLSVSHRYILVGQLIAFVDVKRFVKVGSSM